MVIELLVGGDEYAAVAEIEANHEAVGYLIDAHRVKAHLFIPDRRTLGLLEGVGCFSSVQKAAIRSRLFPGSGVLSGRKGRGGRMLGW
jgi:hypothetical protein